ncbi:MAG: tryptophan 2,3-dioxygenase, partial [Alphaproteobacteria bacterium]
MAAPARFRGAPGRSSGFQFFQYREIEFLVGDRQQSLLKLHENTPEICAHPAAADNESSLYDEPLRLLARC